MKLRPCLSVPLALTLSHTVVATTFDFSYAAVGGSVPATGYSQAVDGITVQITTPEGNMLDYYTFASPGYGIGHSGCVGLICSAGIQLNEMLMVSFSQSVTVNSIALAAWDSPDTAALVATPSGSLVLDDNKLGQVDTFDLSSLGVIDSFTLQATSLGSLFTLRGLDVTAVGPVVPVPAAAWLFGSALLGLGVVGRRRGQR